MEDILTAEERETIDRHFGTEDALDEVDAILVQRILEFIRRSPAVGRREQLTLTAIACLSEHNPDLARSLLQELFEASF